MKPARTQIGKIGVAALVLASWALRAEDRVLATTIGGTTPATPSPETPREIAAPLRSKIIPAYAHSFKRGNRGATIATAPRIFHVPRIVEKYLG